MAKRAFQPPRIAPLQRVVGESITDPAELAAMERIRKRLKKKQKRQSAKARLKGAKAGSNSTAKKKA
jgi:hypothetical protein